MEQDKLKKIQKYLTLEFSPKQKRKPLNKSLYNKVKSEAKTKFKVYPSAYANGWLVKEYKRRGGKYTGSKKGGGLSRWYQEKWIDACKLPKKVTCGRKKSSKKKYPYCRPSIRINKSTPKTVYEISKKTLKKRCSKKRKSPYKRVY
jgi:hypothetical protein